MANFWIEEGIAIDIDGKNLCWVTIHGNGFLQLPSHTFEAYGVKPSDCLLVVRGSYIGIGMAVKGPLVEEARKHSEIPVFQPETAQTYHN